MRCLEYDFNLMGKEIEIINGVFANQKGIIIDVTGYIESRGVVVEVELDNGNIVECSYDMLREL